MSADVELLGKTYRIDKLSAADQFHVFRRVMPIIKPAFERLKAPGGTNKIELILAMSDTLSMLPDEPLDYVLGKCLGSVKVKDGDRFYPLQVNGHLMYKDMDLATTMQVVWAVLMENFRPFLSGVIGAPLSDEEAAQLPT